MKAVIEVMNTQGHVFIRKKNKIWVKPGWVGKVGDNFKNQFLSKKKWKKLYHGYTEGCNNENDTKKYTPRNFAELTAMKINVKNAQRRKLPWDNELQLSGNNENTLSSKKNGIFMKAKNSCTLKIVRKING